MAIKHKSKRSPTLEEWKERIEDWKKSGLQKTIYCRKKEIDYSCFLKWEKRFDPLWKPHREEAFETQKTIVEEWKKTGLSITEYCKKKKIKRDTFYDWKKRVAPSFKEEVSLRTLQRWTHFMEEWRMSGLSRNAYCEKKGLCNSSFYRWERRLNPLGKSHQVELLEKQKAIVEDWKKSGLNRHAYRLQNELTCSFYLWEKKHNPSVSRKTTHEVALEKWTPLIDNWKKSGLNKYTYCRKYGLANSSFSKWEKRLNPSRPSRLPSDLPDEQPVESESLQEFFMSSTLGSSLLGDSSSPVPPRIELTLSQGHRLCLEGSFDWKKLSIWLASLLKR